MSNKTLIGFLILGAFIWLGSIGGLISAMGGWKDITSPAFVGAAAVQLSGVAVMVGASLGIKLSPKE